ncbi:DsbE family thiol:disulfide interchange protein [Ahrensia kielensis]|uniref:DsbE family thiol:disulfide interchange protein n=1 Tax=Ahrensia kielensis TaxID=76980 RepID=A0ABU9T7L6_9HYPH
MSSRVEKKPRAAWFVYVPALAFFVLVGVFALMLTQEGRDASALPSALLGRDAPQIVLPPLEGLKDTNGTALAGLDPAAFAGNITLVNVWASWCAPCREEHPYLTKLSQDSRVQLIGLNYKDKTANALKFLGNYGNPYDAVGVDNNGRGAIDWGVYGVPETFLVGPDGKIRFKFAGPLNPEIIEKQLMPEIDKLAPAG